VSDAPNLNGDVVAMDALPLLMEANEALVGRDTLRHALLSLLEWAKRYRGGDPSLNPEEFYIVTEYAQVVLDRTNGEADAS
jgi:hypothetical protein